MEEIWFGWYWVALGEMPLIDYSWTQLLLLIQSLLKNDKSSCAANAVTTAGTLPHCLVFSFPVVRLSEQINAINVALGWKKGVPSLSNSNSVIWRGKTLGWGWVFFSSLNKISTSPPSTVFQTSNPFPPCVRTLPSRPSCYGMQWIRWCQLRWDHC